MCERNKDVDKDVAHSRLQKTPTLNFNLNATLTTHQNFWSSRSKVVKLTQMSAALEASIRSKYRHIACREVQGTPLSTLCKKLLMAFAYSGRHVH